MLTYSESSVIDWTGCPKSKASQAKVSGVPILKHSRMPADEIVENYADGLGADEIAEVFQLPAKGVRLLLAYAIEQNPALRP